VHNFATLELPRYFGVCYQETKTEASPVLVSLRLCRESPARPPLRNSRYKLPLIKADLFLHDDACDAMEIPINNQQQRSTNSSTQHTTPAHPQFAQP
jgi:hypothetical protein